MTLRVACLGFLLATSGWGHVVSQISGVWQVSKAGEAPWAIEVMFDAGYAMPDTRGDRSAPPPQRDWLVQLGEAGWAPLRVEAERYLRECLAVERLGKELRWRVEFVDFQKSPPDFPELLTDGAYFRMRICGEERLESETRLIWRKGKRPTFVLMLPGEAGCLGSLKPGETMVLPTDRQPVVAVRASGLETFVQGFLHVLPKGLDHVLFVLGLFFYQRAWRPLVAQSLAFTLAHTLTLGLAAAGLVVVPGRWVEPLIALSLVVVAVENLRAVRKPNSVLRLAVVFSFGLVHGLGFAGALSVWLQPGAGFLPGLLCANLGVEAAQVTLLGAAWLLTLKGHGGLFFSRLRVAGSLAIALVGVVLFCSRLSLFG
jgi:HupE / UreJ protein